MINKITICVHTAAVDAAAAAAAVVAAYISVYLMALLAIVDVRTVCAAHAFHQYYSHLYKHGCVSIQMVLKM